MNTVYENKREAGYVKHHLRSTRGIPTITLTSLRPVCRARDCDIPTCPLAAGVAIWNVLGSPLRLARALVHKQTQTGTATRPMLRDVPKMTYTRNKQQHSSSC